MSTATIATLNEQMGTLPSILDAAGDSAWVIKDVQRDALCAIAKNRATAEYIVYEKAKEHGLPPETWSIEVWRIMQSPTDYEDE